MREICFAIILIAGICVRVVPAIADGRPELVVQCEKARDFLKSEGGIEAAIKEAERRGYTRAQIDAVRRRCGI